jgi:hypothetical protein
VNIFRIWNYRSVQAVSPNGGGPVKVEIDRLFSKPTLGWRHRVLTGRNAFFAGTIRILSTGGEKTAYLFDEHPYDRVFIGNRPHSTIRINHPEIRGKKLVEISPRGEVGSPRWQITVQDQERVAVKEIRDHQGIVSGAEITITFNDGRSVSMDFSTILDLGKSVDDYKANPPVQIVFERA